MKKHRNIFQTREQDKNLRKDLNEMKISDLPDKELKIMVIKMLTENWRKMHEQSDNFNKEIKNVGRYQREFKELKNTMIELQKTIEGFKNIKRKKESVNSKTEQWNSSNESNKKKKKEKVKKE